MRNSDNDADLVIITALQKEASAVLDHLGDSTPVVRRGRTFYRSEIYSSKVNRKLSVIVLPQDQMGNVESAMATTQAIEVWNPQFLLLVGIAGGIESSDKTLGDIVVSEQVVNYEIGKVKNTGLENRWDVIKGSPLLLNIAKNMDDTSWVLDSKVARPDYSNIKPSVHFGVVGSGEKVIANKAFSNLVINNWSKMAAVEMESYGVAYAAYKAESAPHFLMIKSICDWADSTKNDAWQNYCADIAASYATSIIDLMPFQSTQRPQAQKKTVQSFSHRSKIGLCGRMGDSWEDLADWYDIPLSDRARFRLGRECQDIWNWLLQRGRLDNISDGLKGIGRDDLVDELIP